MKKIVSLFVILFLAALQTNAQLVATAGVSSQKYSDEVKNVETEGRVGYEFGLSYRIGKRLYVEPGVFWTSAGSEVRQISDLKLMDFVNEDIDFRAVKVPLYLGLKIIDEELFVLRFRTGPSASFITKVGRNNLGIEKSDFQSTIWGWNYGVGVDLLVFTLDLTYEKGMSSMFKDLPVKNDMISLTVGIKFISE